MCALSSDMILNSLRDNIRREVLKELEDEGYIRASDCPRAREDKKIKELKKAKKTLERRNTRLYEENKKLKAVIEEFGWEIL